MFVHRETTSAAAAAGRDTGLGADAGPGSLTSMEASIVSAEATIAGAGQACIQQEVQVAAAGGAGTTQPPDTTALGATGGNAGITSQQLEAQRSVMCQLLGTELAEGLLDEQLRVLHKAGAHSLPWLILFTDEEVEAMDLPAIQRRVIRAELSRRRAAGQGGGAAAPEVAARGISSSQEQKPQDPLAIQQLQSQQLLLQQQLDAANSAKAQTETRAARRVYVGNLQPLLVTEDQLKAIFNSGLMAAFPESSVPGMEPVVAITRQPEGQHAFIEFRTPEMATDALQLSGQVTLHGKPMTVQRPQDYVDPAKSAQAAQMAQMLLAGIPQPGLSMGLAGAVPGGLPAGMALPGPPPQ